MHVDTLLQSSAEPTSSSGLQSALTCCCYRSSGSLCSPQTPAVTARRLCLPGNNRKVATVSDSPLRTRTLGSFGGRTHTRRLVRVVVVVRVVGRRAIQQSHAIGQLVVQVVAGRGRQRATMSISVGVAPVGQGGIFHHVTIHLWGLVQVPVGVELCGGERVYIRLNRQY